MSNTTKAHKTFLLRLDPVTHRELKTLAAQRGVTMNELTVKALQTLLKSVKQST